MTIPGAGPAGFPAAAESTRSRPSRSPGRGLVSRRNLLTAGAGLAVAAALSAGAVESRLLPGRSHLDRLLGRDGPAGTIPHITPGPLVHDTFRSPHMRGRSVGYAISYPPGQEIALPVLVVLHGRGGDHTQAFGDYLGLDRFLAQAVSSGTRPFAIASVDGGDHSYWHRRTTGEDAGAMLTDEFVPLLARHRLTVSRISLLGWSMGGYGALWLATQLGRPRISSVVAESPAIWRNATDSASGAFDGPDDFAAHTIFGRQAELAGVPLRVDCGTDDGFCPAARDLAASLTPRPTTSFHPGGHDPAYWRRMAPTQLAFVAAHF